MFGEEDDWKEGLMKTGDWGEPAPFIRIVVSDLGWIRFVLGTEFSAGLYIANCADMLTREGTSDRGRLMSLTDGGLSECDLKQREQLQSAT